jgi:DNA mismatch repair ATPase MutS
MVQTISAVTLYQEQLVSLNSQLTGYKKKQNLFGWLRLALFIFSAIVAFSFFTFSIIWGAVTIIIAIICFIIIVSIDADNNKRIRNTKHLIKINEEELLVLNNEFCSRYDGSSYAPAVHDYANDLDIFGPSSLFQYINRGNSEQGRELLANNFLNPLQAEEIAARHIAIKELAPQYQWRQQLASYLQETPVTFKSQKRIESWINDPEDVFTHKSWKWIIPVYSMVALSIGLATIIGLISMTIFSLFFIIFFVISANFSKKASRPYALLTGVTKEVDAIQEIVAWVENKEFEAPLLLHLQQTVKTDEQAASVQIKHLKDILNRFDLRLNWLAFIFLNTFLLWDVRQVRALNKWKQKNRLKVAAWFRFIGQFEVLHSLATLYFNNPQWCWPYFSKYFLLEGDEIGHPLIPSAKRVTSDFKMQGYPRIAIITGSNMAGKSTFLRSLGVNVLLAQMGAPVCAKSFSLSLMRLLSSMRIEDNLAESTSTFYAELKKLKVIVDAVNSHEPVFILLDEILRGTNSLDRHHGSKALISQMIREKGVAIIATHDVELAKMQDQFVKEIDNYHFDVQVKGEELYFDYRLKNGVCTNLNATILMKKIGIEL